VRRVNLNDLEFEFDAGDPEGFRAGMARFGPAFGAKRTGTSVYDIPPGEALCPYHWEAGEEEWLLVLAGTPTLRDPEGEHELAEGDLLFFAAAPEGAHRIDNKTGSPVRVMMWSEVVIPSATVYPDSDKVGVWTGDEETKGLFRRSSKVEYFDGET
jgi:uncharacterized cupin superfamily protein